MRPSLVIFNPIAGRGLVARLKPTIVETLRRYNVEFDTMETTDRGEAVRLAREAVEAGYQLVVAVGGDGMVHEVVNGLMHAGAGPNDVTLGIIPAGSGNDFVKMLDLPGEDIATACARIGRGQTRVVDIGRINELVSSGRPVFSIDDGRPGYFANMLGIGFTGLAAHESQKIDWLTGLPLYLVAVIRTLALTYRTPHMEIALDGNLISQRTTEVAVANGRCQGGGFWLTPDAEVDDGWFDLAIARGLSRVGILRLIPDLMRGTHIDKEPITMARARCVTIDTAHPLPVQADGEILASRVTHMELEVVPQALRVIA
ncbi:MAG: diacylglycerol kinase family lipid kinase [Chloroflexi bacterium]|nr:MAG: diacylglycerol kinase family lipid kinase [Chloroflexota bacterium]